MRKILLVLFLIAPIACLSQAAVGSAVVISNFETAMFSNVNSNDVLGDPSNVTLTWPFTGGFVANNVVVTGSLTEVLTNTYASEADIAVTAPNGSLTLNPTGVGGYSGTIPVGPTNITIPTPFDPAGMVSFEFYESYNDGAGPDQVWDSIAIEFQETVIQDGMFSEGLLPNDATTVSTTGTNVAGGLDYYSFTLSDAVGMPGSFLNVQTYDALTGDTIDTEIALFDASGILVAYDDDGQESALGGLYSMLSFGADDPLTPASPVGSDALPGEDGLTLASGDYTLVVGGYDANFEDLTIGVSGIDEVLPGTSAGDYGLSFTFVPEPATVALLVFGGVGLALRRRR